MPATVIQIDQADVRFGAPPGSNLADDVNPTSLTDYACQVTRAEITSTANTTETTVAATFCQPESRLSVPVASTFVLNLDIFQDWTIVAGLSAWLFKKDATTQAFALYLDGDDNPVAKGLIIVQAGGFGGTPGQPLVATVTLNIQSYPVILDPNGNSIRNGGGVGPNRNSASPGDVFPADSNITASDATNAAKLTGEGFVADPTTNWTVGQKITIGTFDFNWNGTAWAAGAHA